MIAPGLIKKFMIASALLAMAGGAYADTVVSSAAYTNPTAANMGAPIGASGWYFNNVRNGGTAAVDTSHARSGNGSVSFFRTIERKGGYRISA
jgi:hypothetical protein